MSLDTPAHIAQIQADAQRALGAGRRLQLACKMSDAVGELARARICMKHREYDEQAIDDHLTWELYGVRRQRGWHYPPHHSNPRSASVPYMLTSFFASSLHGSPAPLKISIWLSLPILRLSKRLSTVFRKTTTMSVKKQRWTPTNARHFSV